MKKEKKVADPQKEMAGAAAWWKQKGKVLGNKAYKANDAFSQCLIEWLHDDMIHDMILSESWKMDWPTNEQKLL